jgi:hypothetical protein
MKEMLYEVWLLTVQKKRFVVGPLILILLLFGAFMLFTQSSAIAPFIYTLF